PRSSFVVGLPGASRRWRLCCTPSSRLSIVITSGWSATASMQSASQAMLSATTVTSPEVPSRQAPPARPPPSSWPQPAARSTAAPTVSCTRRMAATLPRGRSVADILAAFAVVFLAELGDKTQLVALTLAGRYPAVKVLAALGAAIAVLQTLSVTAGALISEAVPDDAIAIGAGLLFLGFAVWTWRSSDEDEDDEEVRALTPRAGLVSVAGAFFLAELGDETMLTTAGLAADRGAVPVWIGSFAAMLAATTLAVVAGKALTRRVKPDTLRRIGAGAFAV